jgi:hypothetical protein
MWEVSLKNAHATLQKTMTWKVSPQEVEAGDCQAHCYCSELEWMTWVASF